MRRNFARAIVDHLQSAAERGSAAESFALNKGLLQRLDARAKVAGLFAIVLSAVWSHDGTALLLLLLVTIALAAASCLPVRFFLPVGGAILFACFIATPALFLTPGAPAFHVPLLGVATIPGVRTASLLVLRVTVATAASSLLILTTPWAHVLKSLRLFRVPVVAIVILSMTYRYVFVLLRIATDLFEARESRRVGRLTRGEQRQLIASGIGVLLSKALAMSEDVYMAMRSRGFQGEVYLLNDLQMRAPDWAFAAAAICVAAGVTAIR